MEEGEGAGYQVSLLHELVGMLPQVVHDLLGGRAAVGGLGLAGDQQRVHQRLGVVAADADQQAVDQAAHDHLAGVDASYDLRRASASSWPLWTTALGNIFYLRRERSTSDRHCSQF